MTTTQGVLPIFCLLFLFASCAENKQADQPSDLAPSISSAYQVQDFLDTTLTDTMLYDKFYGMLLGSAIGDAMGAPTEMWSRGAIVMEHGFVDDLDVVVREASPEGPWDFNLPPGGTTDDTRWKALSLEFLEASEKKRARNKKPLLDAQLFAKLIVDRYLEGIEHLKATDSFHPEPFEVNARKMTWLQEWALVAKPYMENDLDQYANALSHFYGGEMSCAGMLYAPALGAFYPGRAEVAYQQTYNLALFDLGYARDLTALTAAMTAAAMPSTAQAEDVLSVVRDVDPEHYFKSRLIGRTAYRYYKIAYAIHYETQQIKKVEPDSELDFPKDYPYDSLYFVQTEKAYDLLEENLQDIPFHAGEIFLINLTALFFSEMDFEKALQFVTNFGRDNDTVGAVTGAILGAYCGAEKLPPKLVEQVLKTNKEELGIDLEDLAQRYVALLKNRMI